MEESEVKSKPWQWPGEWFKDEKFWREVTARSVSGVIVLVLAAFGAVAAGLIVEPQFPARLTVTVLTVFFYIAITLKFTERWWSKPADLKPVTSTKRVVYVIATVLWLAVLGYLVWAANYYMKL
jgi:hypothetical protein